MKFMLNRVANNKITERTKTNTTNPDRKSTHCVIFMMV